jgi:hypothetical protein
MVVLHFCLLCCRCNPVLEEIILKKLKYRYHGYKSVLRIWDVYLGSRTQNIPSQIPDPNLSISDPGSASKNLSILTQKIVSTF